MISSVASGTFSLYTNTNSLSIVTFPVSSAYESGDQFSLAAVPSTK